MINKSNQYIKFIFTVAKRKYYYIVVIKKNNYITRVITNANDIEEAYENVSDEFPLYKIINYKLIPTEYKEEYDTGEKKLLNIYNKTRNGHELYKQIEHKVLVNQTEEMILHMYSRLYKDYYVQILCNIKKRIRMTAEVMNLTKRLRAETKLSLQLCMEASAKALNETKDIDEAFKKAKNLLIEANKDKVIKGDSSNFKYFITTTKHLPRKAVMLKYGCNTKEVQQVILNHYTKLLDDIQNIYLINSSFYKIDNKTSKVIEKPLLTKNDLLNMRFITGDNDGKTIYNVLNEIQKVTGEKFELVAVEKTLIPKELWAHQPSYIHHNGAFGATLIYDVKIDKLYEDHQEFIGHLLHQMVLNQPLCIKRNELSKSILKHASNSIKETLLQEIKNEENIVVQENLKKRKDQIIEKRIQKFVSEAVLEEQEYILDDKFKPKIKGTKIKDMLEERGITLFDFILI